MRKQPKSVSAGAPEGGWCTLPYSQITVFWGLWNIYAEILKTGLGPCYSTYNLGTSSVSTWGLLEMKNLGPHPGAAESEPAESEPAEPEPAF